jgi:hypothetical protein
MCLDNKKPASLYSCGFSGFLWIILDFQLVEAAGIDNLHYSTLFPSDFIEFLNPTSLGFGVHLEFQVGGSIA